MLKKTKFSLSEKTPYETRDERVPLNLINILPQPRRTFEQILDLANDIAANGLINAITIALFTPKQCKEHLRVINSVWGTHICLKNLQVNLDGNYFVLVAGERRLRACRLLQTEGCDNHKPIGCYHLHMGDNCIKATLCCGISPIEALKLQASENKHLHPPPHEEAEFYDKLFRMLYKASGDKLTCTDFARFMGRSPEVIRNAIRFAKLPEEIRNLVWKRWLPYGIACEIARLQEAEVKKEELMNWAINAITKNPKVSEFRKTVAYYLQQRNSPQSSFLSAIFSAEQERVMRRMLRRKSIGQGTIWSFYAFLTYFRRLLNLFELGLIGEIDSPFLMRGPLKALRELIEIMEEIIPHLKKVQKKRRFKNLANNIKKTEKLLRKAEKITEQLEVVAEGV